MTTTSISVTILTSPVIVQAQLAKGAFGARQNGTLLKKSLLFARKILSLKENCCLKQENSFVLKKRLA